MIRPSILTGTTFFLSILSILLSPASASSSDPFSRRQVTLSYPISSPYYPVVLTGKMLPTLRKIPVGKITFYAVHQSVARPIPFQIDRRDYRGVFRIPRGADEEAREARLPLHRNDECVFMASDIGEKMGQPPDGLEIRSILAIKLTDPETGRHGWVYAFAFRGEPPEISPKDYVTYHREEDSVESAVYRVAYSREKPLLIESSIQKDPAGKGESPNFTDTLKIRHRGKLFHHIDFLRTQADYTSRLAAVKDGPVRVIRKTVNRIRVLWRLRTPAINVDYIHYGHAFFMEMRLHVPFRTEWFFSDMATLVTIDGNDDPSLPPVRLFSDSFPEGMEINGEMTPEKEAFNRSGDKYFALSSRYGKTFVKFDLAKDSLIHVRAYVMDDRNLPDPPERIPGQFGNIGFYSTGWDKLGISVQHLIVGTYMVPEISIAEGLALLKHAPSFVQ